MNPEVLDTLPPLISALLAGETIGLIYWFALRRPPGARNTLLAISTLLLFSTPLLIPASLVRLRALAMFLAADVFFKLVDATRRAREYQASSSTFADWLRFLIPFPILLVTGEERQAARHLTTPLAVAAIRFAVGLIVFPFCWVALFAMQHSDLLRTSFALDHVVKVALFVLTLEVVNILSLGLDRLTGFETKPLINRIGISRTPAEFWLRYNTRIHAWLTRNVFIPVGGFRRPVRGVFLVFFVSAVMHEAAFDIALSRVDGYQFSFFVLQIPAVLASPALERFAKRGGIGTKILAHVITIAWLVATAVLFFRGVGQIFPFLYTAEPPPPLFGEWTFAPAPH